MKNIFFLCFALLILSKTMNAQWALFSNGLQCTYVSRIVESNSFLFAGSDNGVFRSTDYGVTWTSFNTGLTNKYINDITIKGTSVFTATSDGVFASPISSANWIKTSMQNYTSTLATDTNNILAFVDGKDLYRSVDDGVNWTKINFVTTRYGIWDLVISNTKIFVGTQSDGLYYSVDNGNNWKKAALNEGQISALLMDNNIIYVATQSGVYTSTNDGANWIQSNLTNTTIWSFAKYNKNIFAGSYGKGVCKTENNGATWSQINTGLTDVNSTSYEPIAISGKYIFVASAGNIYRRNLSEIVSVSSLANLPNTYFLGQNFPNPFNPSTTISFAIPNPTFVTIKVFDSIGREIENLVNSFLSSGNYKIDYNSSGLSSGIYFYSISTGDFKETKKMLLLK